MNNRQVANIVAKLVKGEEHTQKIRAIRLYVEKTTGLKASETVEEAISDELVAVMASKEQKEDSE